MAAVALTAGTSEYTVWGNKLVLTADITSVDDLDTFTPAGFSKIDNVVFTPTTAVVVVPSVSGTTITFLVAAGSVAGRITVWGDD